jgi:hypothetical protein
MFGVASDRHAVHRNTTRKCKRKNTGCKLHVELVSFCPW